MIFACVAMNWQHQRRPLSISYYLRTDTTREFFLKRKLINYTKNELQGINILKLRLPNDFKCCLNFFIVGMGTNVK